MVTGCNSYLYCIDVRIEVANNTCKNHDKKGYFYLTHEVGKGCISGVCGGNRDSLVRFL